MEGNEGMEGYGGVGAVCRLLAQAIDVSERVVEVCEGGGEGRKVMYLSLETRAECSA